MKELRLRAFWQKAMTIKEFAARTEVYLQILKELNPKFDKMVILKAKLDKIPIESDFSNFKELFYHGCFNKELVYSNVNQNDFLTDESMGRFRITLSNRRKHTDDVFQITFNQNGDYLLTGKYDDDFEQSYLQIKFPEDDPSFFEFEFCKEVLRKTARFWKAEFANIYTFDFLQKTKSGKSGFGGIGWLNWFPDREVLDYTGSLDGYGLITSGSYPDCIICLSETLPEVNNKEAVNKAVHLRDKLEPHGFLNWKTK